MLPQALVEEHVADLSHTHTVSVDNLRPAPKLDELERKKPVILHPSLRECGENFITHDYDACEDAVTECVLKRGIMWMHLCTQACVEIVQMFRLSELGQLPFILQVRALEPFKKGALVLVPAPGRIWRGTLADSGLQGTEGVVHEALVAHVQVTLICGKLARRKATESAPKRHPFTIGSPLLAGKKKEDRHACLHNIAPFWAVLRCAGPKALPNMKFDTMIFDDQGSDTHTGSFPKLERGVRFAVEMPILRNTIAISKGDILCLPFGEDE
jgi:hypothetical protein